MRLVGQLHLLETIVNTWYISLMVTNGRPEPWYIRYGRRISRDPRLRKWDENWNICEFRELATLPGREATLTWAFMGLT